MAACYPAAPVRCYYAPRPAERPACQLSAILRVGATPLCRSCFDRRSTLGKAAQVRPLTAAGTDTSVDLLDWVTQAAAELVAAEYTLAAVVHRARQHGHSWAAIGQCLAVTRQAAQQRFKEARMP